MTEQTPTTGQNPFNLIDQDIADQANTTQNVSTTPTTNDVPVTNTTETNPVNNANNAPKKDLFEEITWKVAKFFAKLLGQPDPETGKVETSTTNPQTPTTPDNSGNTQTGKIDFNSVMSGVSGFMDKVSQGKVVSNVTGFLDKVGDKIEEKTGINLGTQTEATAPQETPATPAETQTTEPVAPQPAETPVENTTPAQPTEPTQPVAPTTETPTTQQ